jgi:hypothetical protein
MTDYKLCGFGYTWLLLFLIVFWILDKKLIAGLNWVGTLGLRQEKMFENKFYLVRKFFWIL